jgi:threonyl-tRNA synthetase
MTATGGIRIEADFSSERMQKKIRTATKMKVPYMLVLGDREMETSSLAVRMRSGKDLGSMTVEQFLERLRIEIKSRQDLE